MKKVKVLHKISNSIGGLEKYIFNSMEFINRDKFQFDFLTRNKNLVNTKEYAKYGFGIKYFSPICVNEKSLFIKEIEDIFDEGYDSVHLHTSQWTGFLLEEIALRKNIPQVIIHAHSSGITVPITDQNLMENIKKYNNEHEENKKKFNEIYGTDFCACSWAASDWLFGSQIPKDKIVIMKNAIDVEKYKFNPKIREDIRRKLNIEDCFVLGNIGRISYEKNQEFLVDVFSEVYKRNEKSRLLLVGTGPLEDNIKRKVSEYGLDDVVIFLGWRDDVSQILQAMDLFLLPSKFEGLGIVLIEAQAAGLKCLASINITREVGITKNIEFFPLEVDKWVEEIFELSNGYERKDMESEVTNAGYNIRYAVKELEKLYLKQ